MARKAIRANNSLVSSSSSLTLSLKPFDVQIPLLTTNALVGLSTVEGNLDYAAYAQYLTRHGHLRNPPNNQSFCIPAQPTSSSMLQQDRGDRTDGLTDYRPDQALWSQDNLPEIIYIFNKPTNWLGRADLKEPPVKSYPIYGKLLRDIPILPDHISPDLEGWRYEAFCRFDPRIRREDIICRFPPEARGEHHSDLSMRTIRFRRDANVLGWVAKGGKFQEDKLRIQGRLQAAGISLTSNTTRGITWGDRPNGQPIPVPAKLRWHSCVEAAPAQPAVATAVPVANASPTTPFLTVGPGPLGAPIPAATASDSALPAYFTASVKTIPSVRGASIPARRSPNTRRTQIPVLPVVLSSSSSSVFSPQQTLLAKQSTLPPHPPANSVPGNSMPNYLLDPVLFQMYPTGQLSVSGKMKSPPQFSQAWSPPNNGNSIRKSKLTAPSLQQISDVGQIVQQPSPRSYAPLPAPSFDEAVAGPSPTNPEITNPQDWHKRKRGSDDEDASPSTERAFRKPRRVLAASANCESQRRFQTRFPRTAFGGITEGIPQSLSG